MSRWQSIAMKRRMPKLAKSILINGLIFFSVYLLVHLYQTRSAPSGIAPEIQGVMLDGTRFQGLASVEKPVLVHFWATWCKVCEFEHGSINQIAQDYPVIGIASQSGSLADVSAYVAEHQLSFPVLVGNGSNAAQWGIVGYPSSFIVGEDGQIKFTEVGFTSEMGLRLRLWLASFF